MFRDVRPTWKSSRLKHRNHLTHMNLYSSLGETGANAFLLIEEKYLFLSDYSSKLSLMFSVETISATAILQWCLEVFSQEGTAMELFTENWTLFHSEEITSVCRKWNAKHTTSSPHCLHNNESTEKYEWIMMFKARASSISLHNALIILRTKTLSSRLPSPVEIIHKHAVIVWRKRVS